MSSLLSKARAAFVISGEVFDNRYTDDSYMNWAAFDLQQSIAIGLRALLDTQGKETAPEAEVSTLLKHVLRKYHFSGWYKTLDTYADVIDMWEDKARFDPDFTVSVEQYLKVREAAKTLLYMVL